MGPRIAALMTADFQFHHRIALESCIQPHLSLRALHARYMI
jgi:hypothetical protein